MPTVFRDGPYRFFFFSADGHEPPHVHIERDQNVAKFWLDPVRLAESGGFGAHELRILETRVRDQRERLLKAWDEFFAD